jgi:hypothetical protein
MRQSLPMRPQAAQGPSSGNKTTSRAAHIAHRSSGTQFAPGRSPLDIGAVPGGSPAEAASPIPPRRPPRCSRRPLIHPKTSPAPRTEPHPSHHRQLLPRKGSPRPRFSAGPGASGLGRRILLANRPAVNPRVGARRALTCPEPRAAILSRAPGALVGADQRTHAAPAALPDHGLPTAPAAERKEPPCVVPAHRGLAPPPRTYL